MVRALKTPIFFLMALVLFTSSTASGLCAAMCSVGVCPSCYGLHSTTAHPATAKEVLPANVPPCCAKHLHQGRKSTYKSAKSDPMGCCATQQKLQQVQDRALAAVLVHGNWNACLLTPAPAYMPPRYSKAAIPEFQSHSPPAGLLNAPNGRAPPEA